LLVASFIYALGRISFYVIVGSAAVRLMLGSGSVTDASVEANRAAVVLAVLMWPTLMAAMESGYRRLAFVLPVVTFAVLLLTDSQTAPLVMLIGVLVYIVCRVTPRLGFYMMLVAGAAVILLMPFFFQATCPALLHGGPDWSNAAVGAHFEIWCAVSSAIPDALFFGHGVEAARAVQDWGVTWRYFGGTGILHPHNAALQIWYEYGAVGAVLASAVWCATVLRISNLGPSARSVCFAALTSIAVVGYVNYGLWQSWWLGSIGVVPALFRMVAGKIWFSSRD
jgi:O-antigen ligase